MRIRIGYTLAFNIVAPTPILMMLFVRPERALDLEYVEEARVEPNIPVYLFTDNFGNKCGRVVAGPGLFTVSYDNTCRDSGLNDEVGWNAHQHDVSELPPDTLRFLLASRYCEVDRFSEMAWRMFGHTQPGWPRVQAVCDWVHNNVRFGYQFASYTKTAYDVYEEKRGVCRDFQHLSITFIRALGIPARYATGYLGDIGVPPSPSPMDFSAWFEVYLSGRWWTMDARHNKPRIGRVLMAVGRDAADTALTTSFGVANLTTFQVRTEELA